MSAATAAAASIARCHDCGLLTPLAPGAHGAAHGPGSGRASGAGRGSSPHGPPPRCRRCDAVLHLRKPDSVARTWALLVAAYILYVPANLLPVSTVVWLGRGEPDTIFSGVVALFQSGDAPVALLLFFASIMVPLLKMAALTWLLLAVRFKSLWRPRDRTVLYRFVEVIGRWSMLDIFVISLLVALVKLEALASIDAGPGAVAFAAVVILTMLAAESFDPRLMWDVVEDAS